MEGAGGEGREGGGAEGSVWPNWFGQTTSRRCERLGAPIPTLGANVPRWQTARRGPGPGLGPGEPTEGIPHLLPSQECRTEGRGCRTRPSPCPPRNLLPSPAGQRGFWSRWRERKVRAGVSGWPCKQSCVFNKYYLCNCGGLGASRSGIEED